MKKKMLWKDIFKSISKSKGRFFSIFGLMLLGSFALVGLKVTGPDMRATGKNYVNRLDSADITIISPLGLDDNDVKTIDKAKGTQHIEYGYLKDVVTKGSDEGIRLYSMGKDLSGYHLVKGRLPENGNEIALDNNHNGKYKIGDTFKVTEKADATGTKILKKNDFKIVGFVYSAEILSNINMGQSTAGSGELKGYGVVIPDTFDSQYYMLARMNFKDTVNVDPYTDEYTDKIQAHKDSLSKLLKDQPEIRLADIQQEYQKQIDDGQKKIDDAKKQLADAKEQLASGQLKIEDGQEQIQQAQDTISQGETQLASAQEALDSGKTTLDEKWNQLQAGKSQLDAAKSSLDAGATQLSEGASAIANGKSQLDAGQSQITQKESELTAAKKEYAVKKAELDTAQANYNAGKAKYDAAEKEISSNEQQLNDGKAKYEAVLQQLSDGLNQANAGLSQIEQQLEEIEKALAQPDLPEDQKQQLEAQQQVLNQKKTEVQQQVTELTAKQSATQAEYDAFKKNTYDPGMAKVAAAKKELAAQKQELDQAATKISAGQQQLTGAEAQINNGEQQLNAAKEAIATNQQVLAEKEQQYQGALTQYNNGQASYNQNQATYYAGLDEWTKGVETLDTKSAEYQANKDKLASAKSELASKETDLAEAKGELSEKQKEFDEKEPDAEKKIKDAEEKLKDAQETLDKLKAPVYSLNSRREIPGSEGYKIYSTISKIVDALANVFPIFLYFVAALVTSTTMARFVDEERINSGTLKALGYSNKDVLKKFTFYGLVSSLLGTIIGIILGHTLLPFIVYNAYHDGFVFQNIEWHFNPWISLVAILLAMISSIGPAWLVAAKELKEKPAQLLLPKPPAAGSKILLERLPFIWNKMSFTHKVTARNIFRYKKRMLMTIFGVAGAVALLFAGFSVQHSIGGISDRQFGDIIHYDMIVAENNRLLDKQKTEIEDQLKDGEVKESLGIHYEAMNKIAGDNKDTQEIKLIVPSEKDQLKNYVALDNRKTGDSLKLPDDGVIISERLAKLLNVEKGDTITLNDADNVSRKMKVSGITEMYMGHFVFTSKTGYEHIFGTDYLTNAYLVNLDNNSISNTEKQAAEFMNLAGVEGVVQNTTMINQVHTIVNSLNKIMKVLIVIAALLGIVILYNLTNINVSERIRELSTIKVLGFYDKEVTLYIYRETILLTILGILAGFGIGEILHQYIITVVPPDDVMFNPALGVGSFLIPTLIIAIVTTILGFVVNYRLKNVDMLEALKSVD
ncbi:FtsX-like permease family protein [Enterococcus thailandicus]|uniref:FtsX-like permease family protein n=1 Tax=Enterococcus thailandicus TaxID=417368 RepID=UPI0022EBD80E|nr:FtsX-like permease family protein [Enterococcus thailandicus]MDA3974089.1 FtsX-like permease family protein [Enterococcus thailandicus]MDA3976749.1 FtsX-like permease family protein [Enterococcus thailandicus]MDA3981543.1 FtsX-like permease family protein [Enterococcus thailandicus]